MTPTFVGLMCITALAAAVTAATRDIQNPLYNDQNVTHETLNGFRLARYPTEDLSRAFGQGRLPKIRKAVDRFPTLDSCLAKDHIAHTAGDMAFDWRRVDTSVEMEVCVFRIAQALAEPERMVEVFAALGFATVSQRTWTFGPPTTEAGRKPVVVSAHWHQARNANPKPLPHIHRLNVIARWLQQDLSILVFYAPTGSVSHVSVAIKIY